MIVALTFEYMPKPPCAPETLQRIADMYVEQQMTAREIAPLVGYSPAHVSKLLKVSGVPARRGPRAGRHKGGAPSKWAGTDAECRLRLKSNIEVNDRGCWIWQGRKRGKYGEVNAGGSRGRCATHRLSFEVFKGPIPADCVVMHSCDVPLCCNPKHLFTGSTLNNVTDCVEKNRQAKGEGQGLAVMTKKQVMALRSEYRNGETQTRLASKYGIHQATVSQIVRRVTWKHIP